MQPYAVCQSQAWRMQSEEFSSASESSKIGCYKLSEDLGIHNWCDRCFELYIDENETQISDDEFSEIMSFYQIQVNEGGF